MIKRLIAILFIFYIFFSFATPSLAKIQENQVDVYIFYGDGCPHCAEEKDFLTNLELENPNIQVKRFEIWYNETNRKKLEEISNAYGVPFNLEVPKTFISDKVFMGFANESGELVYLDEKKAFLGYKNQIFETINYCLENDCPQTEQIVSGAVKPATAENDKEINIAVPFLGEINVRGIPIIWLTIILGLMDGFNACAMFVLLVLLGILVRTKSRKRMALVAGMFIFVSGLMYFLFMTAWLNLFLTIGSMGIAFTIVGIIAIVVGLFDIKDFFFFGKGPTLSIPKSAKPDLYKKMYAAVNAHSLAIMLITVTILAISVNFVEFLCTFGLPMVFTKVLAATPMSDIMRYFYLVLYQVFYMLDDMIMVGIAIYTLSSQKMTEKYGRFLKLITGLLMIVLGVILLLNPALIAG